jgi:hypothetical protein
LFPLSGLSHPEGLGFGENTGDSNIGDGGVAQTLQLRLGLRF